MDSSDLTPSESSPQALLFDVGGVIVRLNLARAFGPVAAALASGAGAGQNPQRIWQAIQQSPRWHDWQEGRMTPEEWHQHITGYLGIRVSFADFCAAWNSALDPETMLPDELFARLGTLCRLGLLSNTDPLHMENIERHFSFVRYFPARVYSCRVGARKPNPLIYRRALKELGASAEQVCYIDDVADFVMAARRLGMDGIEFKDPRQLTEELARRGISAGAAAPGA